MARLQIKPSIREENGQFRLIVTATHEVRDRLWDALSNSLNNVIERIAIDNGYNKTQFYVKPYRGYSLRQTYTYTTVFLYSVMTELSLEDFWSLTMKQHLEALKEAITLPTSSEGRDLFNPITEEEMEDALSLRIAYLAYNRIRRWSENLIYEGGYNTGVVHDWWNDSINAYRRLQFVDRTQTFFDVTEWQSRLETCEKQLSVLENAYAQVKGLQEQIVARRKEAKGIRETMEVDADLTIEGEKTLDELKEDFTNASERLEQISTQIKDLSADFDEKPAKVAMKAIKEITPVKKE